MKNEVGAEIRPSEVSFDWPAFMDCLIQTPGTRERVGPAWLLLFDIYWKSDRAGMYSSTYTTLAKRYGVAPITVKKWRRHLCNQSVIESYSRGHSVAFRLREPFLSFLKPTSYQEKHELGDVLLQTVLNTMKARSLFPTPQGP